MTPQNKEAFHAVQEICHAPAALIFEALESFKYDVQRTINNLLKTSTDLRQELQNASDQEYGRKYAEERQNLAQILQVHNLQSHPVRNDGNCAFVSFSKQLQQHMKKETSPEALRSEFVKTVSANWDFFGSFFPDSSKEDLQKYLKVDHWDDNVGDAVLLVLARLYEVHLRFYTPDGIHDHPYYDEVALAIHNSSGTVDKSVEEKKDKVSEDGVLALFRRKSLSELLKHGKRPVLHLVRHGAHWDSTDPFGTKVEEVKETAEVVQLRQMFPGMTKTQLESTLKIHNNDVSRTAEALVHSKDVAEIKKILPQKSEGQIMEALRLRQYKVDEAVQYLMPVTSLFASSEHSDSFFPTFNNDFTSPYIS